MRRGVDDGAPPVFRPSKEKARLARQIGLLTTIPFVLLSGPAVGYFIGSWLDGRFGTEPILLIVMLLLGFGAAGRETYRLILRASHEDPEPPDDDASSPGGE